MTNYIRKNEYFLTLINENNNTLFFEQWYFKSFKYIIYPNHKTMPIYAILIVTFITILPFMALIIIYFHFTRFKNKLVDYTNHTKYSYVV